ncbi:D-alanine--D-alanine ligase family protein [Nannocystis bainbridge]|uniref:ATP-grasp domain-containing protein n=1 Tax=Nannocystis bainbridge TaxID=2995303 RepID=A0ABT5EEK8_9BACT|nr:ATP-grasp domain-containing protein [Nannocystis bainbridge]MDC0723759.1 ATP-grasp domain-containing protein [Nannocystis bainbridge]
MRIAITYHDAPLSDPPVAAPLGAPELAATARDVHAALAPLHACTLVPVGDSVPAALAAVRALAPDVVFNLCEGAIGRTRFEAHLALGLDMLGIPCCGCDPVTLALCQDKPFVKQFLRQTGVPTPTGFAVAPGCSEEHVLEDIRELLARAAAGRVIVKPAREGGGVGVDAGSVCDDAEAALARARQVWARHHQPALIETFVDGPEYNLALYHAGPRGLLVLPPGQIVFAPTLAPERRVVGWTAKWDTASPEAQASESQIAGGLDPAVHAEIVAVCTRAATLLGMTGYCRFDLRAAEGALQVIDVNANPDLGPGSGFRMALAAAGVPFADFLADLIAARLPAVQLAPAA